MSTFAKYFAQRWGSIPCVSLTGLLRLLGWVSLKVWRIGLSASSRWSLMTQLLSWRDMSSTSAGSHFFPCFHVPCCPGSMHGQLGQTWGEPACSSNPSWRSVWNNIILSKCFTSYFAVAIYMLYSNTTSWIINSCHVRFTILIWNATTSSWKRLFLGLAFTFAMETQF